MEKGELKGKILKALEMPAELLNNCPRMTSVGNESVLIENYKAIIEYDKNVIRISNNISIFGENLNVAEITTDGILISGKIKAIEFES